jgi:AraC family transcriptional regulator
MLEVFEQPEVAEFTTSPTPDLLVVMGLQGRWRIESRVNGLWHSAMFRRGVIGMTSPGSTDTLRWQAFDAGARRSVHAHLPHELIEQTRADLPSPTPEDQLNVLDLVDPAAATILTALHTALETGAESLVAESLAQALAAQVLTTSNDRAPRQASRSALLSARRLSRVIDYMSANLQDSIELDDLAREANLSKFHFLRVFMATAGVTPHRYLMELRMERAAQLLSSGRHTVSSVAARCGYSSTGRFTAAFRQRYGTTPGAYRQK